MKSDAVAVSDFFFFYLKDRKMEAVQFATRWVTPLFAVAYDELERKRMGSGVHENLLEV